MGDIGPVRGQGSGTGSGQVGGIGSMGWIMGTPPATGSRSPSVSSVSSGALLGSGSDMEVSFADPGPEQSACPVDRRFRRRDGPPCPRGCAARIYRIERI